MYLLTNIGTGSYSDSNRVSIAKRAALELAVSKIVSTIKISTPPSNNPRHCSAYDLTSSSNARERHRERERVRYKMLNSY